MDKHSLALEMKQTLQRLSEVAGIGHLVDARLQCPQPYLGRGEVRVVFLGQDPTVRNEASRSDLRIVLKLDQQRGPLAKYLGPIAEAAGTTLAQGVYATNIVKNFFTEPPTDLDPRILRVAAQAWRPLLLRELANFPDVPVVALGEPTLRLIAKGNAPRRIRDYWGYKGNGVHAQIEDFAALLPKQNDLGRLVFPLPHQPSMRKEFYRRAFPSYLSFLRDTISQNRRQRRG